MRNVVKKCSIVFASILILLMIYTADSAAKSKLLSGITLDCSNRYYSVAEIERYIRLAQTSGKGYVQLHLTGDRNVGIECRSLGQIADSHYIRNDGEYYNPKTGQSFLTYDQIRAILGYARTRKVLIIPEIDMPGHMKGFRRLYTLRYGSKAARKVFSDAYPEELKIGRASSDALVRKINGEYASLFKGCKYYHMGCDESWSGSAKANARYINRVSSFLRKKGFRVMIWNDLFTRKNYKKINKKLIVGYWSFDGDTESKKERKQRRASRASLPTLQKAGFKLINCNSYYLYYVPSKANTSKEDARYMVRDARKHWNIRKWDGERKGKTRSSKGILGSSAFIWTEDSRGVTDATIYAQFTPLYKAMVKKNHK